MKYYILDENGKPDFGIDEVNKNNVTVKFVGTDVDGEPIMILQRVRKESEEQNVQTTKTD